MNEATDKIVYHQENWQQNWIRFTEWLLWFGAFHLIQTSKVSSNITLITSLMLLHTTHPRKLANLRIFKCCPLNGWAQFENTRSSNFRAHPQNYPCFPQNSWIPPGYSCKLMHVWTRWSGSATGQRKDFTKTERAQSRPPYFFPIFSSPLHTPYHLIIT